METTITIGVGVVGILLGAGVGFGIVRGKLSEVGRLQRALFKKFDELVKEVGGIKQLQARHDERIKANQSDIRQVMGRLPTAPIAVEDRQ